MNETPNMHNQNNEKQNGIADGEKSNLSERGLTAEQEEEENFIADCERRNNEN